MSDEKPDDAFAEIERQIEQELAARKAAAEDASDPEAELRRKIEQELEAEFGGSGAKKDPAADAGSPDNPATPKAEKPDPPKAGASAKPKSGAAKPGRTKSENGTRKKASGGKSGPPGGKSAAPSGKAGEAKGTAKKAGAAGGARKRPAGKSGPSGKQKPKTPEEEAKEQKQKELVAKQEEIAKQIKKKQLIVYAAITLVTLIIGLIVLGPKDKKPAQAKPQPQAKPAAAGAAQEPAAAPDEGASAEQPATPENTAEEAKSQLSRGQKVALRKLEKEAAAMMGQRSYVDAILLYRARAAEDDSIAPQCEEKIQEIIKFYLEGQDPTPSVEAWEAAKETAREQLAGGDAEGVLEAIKLFRSFGSEHPLLAEKAAGMVGKLGQKYHKLTGNFPE